MQDKIIFWIDASLLHFGLAKYLQEKIDSELYAIIDITNNAKLFFKEQQFVKFHKTWYYHDYISKTSKKHDLEYLKSFEEKYKINLWLLAYNERIFYQFNEFYKFTTDEILSILEQECKLFENIIDEIKPKFLLMGTPNFHHTQLFYKICQSKGIKILCLGPNRFAKSCLLSQEIDRVDDTELPTDFEPQRTLTELQNFLKGSGVYNDNLEYKERFVNSKVDFFKAALRFFLSKNSNEKTHYTYYGRTKLRILIKRITIEFKAKYRECFINKNFTTKINENDKSFIYFALPIDQEATLLIGSPFYTNQIELITHIVKSLPIGYKLYIKDHPLQSTRGWRKISYYKQIMDLPNVKLIHPSIPPDEILNKCSLVITVSSSTGLEAVFYKKPTIIFGDPIYSILPSVLKIKTMEELPAAIRTALKIVVNESDLNRYVNFIQKNTIKFDLSGFNLAVDEYFYYGAYLVDVEIQSSRMKSFLEKYEQAFELLVNEHIKKLEQYR